MVLTHSHPPKKRGAGSVSLPFKIIDYLNRGNSLGAKASYTGVMLKKLVSKTGCISSSMRMGENQRFLFPLVISVQIKIDPRGASVKSPQPWWDKGLAKFLLIAIPFVPSVCPNPDAQLIGVYLTVAVLGAPAGPVAGILGAAGFRALKPNMLDGAVSTALAGEK